MMSSYVSRVLGRAARSLNVIDPQFTVGVNRINGVVLIAKARKVARSESPVFFEFWVDVRREIASELAVYEIAIKRDETAERSISIISEVVRRS